MIEFYLLLILFAIILYNWKLVIPKSWYESAVIDIEELVINPGYSLERHKVQTEDGYILTLHRISIGCNDAANKKKRKPPVFLMHGLLCSSVDWIVNGPNKSMGLILADAGYDVWLGNNRGNTFSRDHVSLHPDKHKKEFFNYSYHEIGLYDLPAMIDYVLDITGYKQLTYLGYSEGFTSFLVMGSLRPEYNKKILVMNAFAPVTNVYKVKNLLFNFLGISSIILKLPKYLGFHELFGHSQPSFLRCLTAMWSIGKHIFKLMGSSEEQLPDREFSKIVLANFPAGMSLKQITHYIQGLRSGIFGQFDYGKHKNLARYGSEKVPVYDISKVTSPIILYYGEDDGLVNNDILLNCVAKELPNVVKKFLVPYPQFNHLDFIWGKNVSELNKEALENINKYNKWTL